MVNPAYSSIVYLNSASECGGGGGGTRLSATLIMNQTFDPVTREGVSHHRHCHPLCSVAARHHTSHPAAHRLSKPEMTSMLLPPPVASLSRCRSHSVGPQWYGPLRTPSASLTAGSRTVRTALPAC